MVLLYCPAITHNPTQAPHKSTPTRTRTKQSAYRGFGPKPTHVWNGESYQKATSLVHAQLIRNIHEKFNEELAAQHDGDNNDDE